jgi:hypothetical protein
MFDPRKKNVRKEKDPNVVVVCAFLHHSRIILQECQRPLATGTQEIEI